MSMSIRGPVRRSGAGAVAAAMLLAGAVACSGGGEKNDATGTGAKTGKKRSVTQVITAAYKKTAEAKSARVNMTMSVPGADGGEMTMSGIMGWDPTLMDMTMKGSALAADADMPRNARIIWQNDVVYVDAGAAAAKEMDGKRWMKLDLGAMAEEAAKSGDDELTKGLTGGLEDMNQDPAQQLAMLLDSPTSSTWAARRSTGPTPSTTRAPSPSRR